MKWVKKVATGVRESLNHPGQILGYCCAFFVLTISIFVFPLRLWCFYRYLYRYKSDIKKAALDITDLSLKLSQAADPLYIEKQARDRLDLAGENDLIFVFPSR